MMVRRKSDLVEAMQVPLYSPYSSAACYADDCVKVADWAGGVYHMTDTDGAEPKTHISLTVDGVYIEVPPGGWLVRTTDGGIGVYLTDQAFWESHDLQNDWFWKNANLWGQRVLPWLFIVSLTVATLGLATAIVS